MAEGGTRDGSISRDTDDRLQLPGWGPQVPSRPFPRKVCLHVSIRDFLAHRVSEEAGVPENPGVPGRPRSERGFAERVRGENIRTWDLTGPRIVRGSTGQKAGEAGLPRKPGPRARDRAGDAVGQGKGRRGQAPRGR